MKFRAWLLAAALSWSPLAGAADFGSPGGPEPANLDEVSQRLRQEPYDLELLVSFGTSKGGSAGHLALAIRDQAPGDDLVYSANFYADRDPKHDRDFYTRELVVRVPKTEYLYRTRSTLGEGAQFGLDYGEVYKRSVIGVRVDGVPSGEKAALAAFFGRLNGDYRARERWTAYHEGEVKYGYLDLNCAKIIGAGFLHGAGYAELEVKSGWPLGWIRLVAGLTANIPTEMALKLMQAWHARGYRMHVVLYEKFAGSTWVDPHEEGGVAFKDLPNRFPSVLSRDFRREEDAYRDYDNLRAMYLFHNLGRYAVRIDGATGKLEVRGGKLALPYPEAARLAEESAAWDGENYRRGGLFRARGTPVGEAQAP